MHPQTHSVAGSLAGVLLTLALVTMACMVSRGLLRNRDHPPAIAETLAGLAVGLGVLGFLPGDLPSQVFAVDARPYLMILTSAVLALLMFVLPMFVVGFEIGPPALRLRGGATSAAASLLVPFAAGVALIWWIQPVPASASGLASTQLAQALFIGVAFSATAFSVLARVLDDTALPRLSVRGPTVSAAAARDVVSWTMLAVVVAMAGPVGGASTALRVVGFVGLLLALRHVLRPLGAAVLARSSTASTNSSMALSLIFGGIFLSSCVTAAMHLHPIFGALAFGFACPREIVALRVPKVVETLADAGKILIPVFFVLAGLSMSFGDFSVHDVLITVIVIISTSAAKILSMYATARACRMPSQDSWGLGLLMNTWGLIKRVVLDVGRTAGVLSHRLFTVLAVMEIGTTLVTGPLIAKIYFSNTMPSERLTTWRVRRGRVNTTFPCLRACLKPMSIWATAMPALAIWPPSAEPLTP